MRQNEVRPEVQNWSRRLPFWFLHDGATSHATNPNLNFLTEMIWERVISRWPQPPWLLRLGLHQRSSISISISGRWCTNNPGRDGGRRSSKCAQTWEHLHRGFRRSFWALDQDILKTPTLSYLVIFLDLKFTHYLPSSTVIQICNSRVKPCNTWLFKFLIPDSSNEWQSIYQIPDIWLTSFFLTQLIYYNLITWIIYLIPES